MQDWSSNPHVFEGVESVPVSWGLASSGAKWGGNSEWLIGYNEPDAMSQANIRAARAADNWPILESLGKKLVSPQPTDDGFDWLVDFHSAYVAIHERAPRIDALAVHCYLNSADECISLVKRYEALAREWGIGEVWVTEFAFRINQAASIDRVVDETSKFIAWMEGEKMVARYSIWTLRQECCSGPGCDYDPLSDVPMFFFNGRVSPVGKLYRRLP
jgi:hypothetical protein